MKKWMLLVATVGLATAVPLAAQKAQDPAAAALAEMEPEVRDQMLALDRSLVKQSGRIDVPGGHASLDLGDRYYFLSANDARKVLVNAWGNPPESTNSVLGMVFPKGRTFFDGTWGAVIEYEDTGHVDDKDAAGEDYDQVLDDLRAGEEESNAARKEGGFASVHLVGWAQQPTYDPTSNTLIWARNIKFDDTDVNTLNYDVRKLARTGVLSLNMVDSMPNLALVRNAAVNLGQTVVFDDGQRYADFNASTDKMADYGLAGLVAAGAGLAVAKKAGFLGLLLLFLKKGFVVILAALAGGWAWLRRKFGGGQDEEIYYENDEDGRA